MRAWLLAALILIPAAAAFAWWHFRAPPVDPPFPADLEDPEVRVALEKARRQVLDEPDSAEVWGAYAMLLLAHLFDRDADVCFAEASRLDPNDPKWPYARGLVALKRRPHEAVALLRQAAQARSRPEYESLVRLQLAEALLERGQFDEAEQLFRTQEAETPGSPRAALGLGMIAQARGQETAAESYFRVARSSPYARKSATAQLAALARARGDPTAAAALDKENAELPNDPAWPDLLFEELASLEVGKRGFERKVGRLEKAGEFREAAELYLKEIQERPTVEAYLGAGMNLLRLREYDRAFEFLRKAVEAAPENAQAHYSLALALFARAEREWQTSPGKEQLKTWFQEAIDQAKRAAELRPDHARAYLFWGLALKYLGDPEAGLAPLRNGVACNPADFDLQLALADVLFDAGHKQEAEATLENARRLRADDPRLAITRKRWEAK